MRNVNVSEIEKLVAELCIKANKKLPEALEQKIRECSNIEKSPVGKSVFDDLCANIDSAGSEDLPICQDTGMAVIFMKIGQDVHIEGGLLRDAVNRGVAKGYTDGYLRKSIVGDPLERVNTGDNTPAVLHIDIVEGEEIEIDVCPKGFGSENMSALKMFTPSATHDDIVGFVKECISVAVPAGTVIAYAGSIAPEGFIACNGAAVSRTTYADLFAAIGTLYGEGDGSTTFNLPDLTDRVVQGSATAGTTLAAGLPNITGDIKLRPNSSGMNGFFGITGAFSMGAQGNITATAFDMGSTTGTTYNPVEFNASRSSSIYGNSTTVQPPALTMIYCIKY